MNYGMAVCPHFVHLLVIFYSQFVHISNWGSVDPLDDKQKRFRLHSEPFSAYFLFDVGIFNFFAVSDCFFLCFEVGGEIGGMIYSEFHF